MFLNIDFLFPHNNSRTNLCRRMKFYMPIDLSETKVPIEYGWNQDVGGACVTKNRIPFPYNNSRTNWCRWMKFYMQIVLSEKKVPFEFGPDLVVGRACVT